MIWSPVLAISLGVAVGALLRWQFGVPMNSLFPVLPLGTLAANLVGGYVIGSPSWGNGSVRITIMLPQLAFSSRSHQPSGRAKGNSIPNQCLITPPPDTASGPSVNKHTNAVFTKISWFGRAVQRCHERRSGAT